MTATERLKKQRQRTQVPPRDTSILPTASPQTASTQGAIADAPPEKPEFPGEAITTPVEPAATQPAKQKKQAKLKATRTKETATIKKTSVHLEQERHKSLQIMCLSEDVTMSTLLEAFDLVSEDFPEARTAILEKAQELAQARKELGDKRRSKAFSKRI